MRLRRINPAEAINLPKAGNPAKGGKAFVDRAWSGEDYGGS